MKLAANWHGSRLVSQFVLSRSLWVYDAHLRCPADESSESAVITCPAWGLRDRKLCHLGAPLLVRTGPWEAQGEGACSYAHLSCGGNVSFLRGSGSLTGYEMGTVNRIAAQLNSPHFAPPHEISRRRNLNFTFEYETPAHPNVLSARTLFCAM